MTGQASHKTAAKASRRARQRIEGGETVKPRRGNPSPASARLPRPLYSPRLSEQQTEVSMPETTLVSWSGGKDSCLALYEIQQTRRYEVAALLTTITRDYDRISLHGVRRELLKRQAEALGLPLHEVYISQGATNEEYEARMKETLAAYYAEGIKTIVFGDLFLEDIKKYREQLLAPLGIRGLFPIWKRDTAQTIRAFLELGFKAVVTCLDPRALDQSFAGKVIDEDFLRRLPPQVDPCGENGEFHTFVFAGPNFREPVKFSLGEVVVRDSFCFCDLLPA
jgi:uncharacterized protein (TIGR00290 family)